MADNKIESFFNELFNELESLADGGFWEKKPVDTAEEIVTFKRNPNGKRRSKPENTFNANPSTEEADESEDRLEGKDSRRKSDNTDNDNTDKAKDSGTDKPDKD